ncbi:MAG: hypothetical protein HY587_08730 [Candidatus Omnitrophica bacterium]|nr:hypothetical protein [Candidatus Omnitrophota bacterium]
MNVIASRVIRDLKSMGFRDTRLSGSLASRTHIPLKYDIDIRVFFDSFEQMLAASAVIREPKDKRKATPLQKIIRLTDGGGYAILHQKTVDGVDVEILLRLCKGYKNLAEHIRQWRESTKEEFRCQKCELLMSRGKEDKKGYKALKAYFYKKHIPGFKEK